MTSPRPARFSRSAARALAACVLLSLLTALPAAAKLRSLGHVRFCVVETVDADAACAWERVELPHRWRPAATGTQWARYLIDPGEMEPGLAGIVVSGLSPGGSVRIGGRWLDGTGPNAHSGYLRYEPQVFPLSFEGTRPPAIEIVSLGHPAVVNGLRTVSLGPIADALDARERLWIDEVLWPLLVAGGTLVAGAFALVASSGAQRLSSMLRILGALSVLVALRMSLNHVTGIPVALGDWTRIKLGLLMLIDVTYCLPVLAYLRPGRERQLWAWVAAGLLAALGLVLVPDADLLRISVLAFLGLGAAGFALLAWLVARLARVPERLGVLLALCFGGALAAGLLDLLIHLSWIAPGHAGFQRTAAPILLVLILFLLVRESTAYRALELQLARESGRRENLLRDLHDVVGSRLVALAFRARRDGVDPVIRTGIDDLLRELQMIQQVVRSAPARLDELLADIRNVYGDWSDASPRIVWRIDDSVSDVSITSEQAVATVRIIQEAIANAMRHGHPDLITVHASRREFPALAEVSVEDDGDGDFRIGEHGGLRNMLARAQGAGLVLAFESWPRLKAIRITYPEALDPQ